MPEWAGDGALQALGVPQLVGCLAVIVAEEFSVKTDHILGEVLDLALAPRIAETLEILAAHDRSDARTSTA